MIYLKILAYQLMVIAVLFVVVAVVATAVTTML